MSDQNASALIVPGINSSKPDKNKFLITFDLGDGVEVNITDFEVVLPYNMNSFMVDKGLESIVLMNSGQLNVSNSWTIRSKEDDSVGQLPIYYGVAESTDVITKRKIITED